MPCRTVPFLKYLLSITLSFALIALSPGFAAYEEKTDRTIPLVRLTKK